MSTNLIEIVEHNPDWSNEFRTIAMKIAASTKSIAQRVDHIGSTSVGGLPAKDRIDIQLSIASASDFDQVQECLESIGYSMVPHILDDHIPPDGPFVEEQWQKRFFRPPTGQRATNLHVRINGLPNQRYALLFRDYLRAHAHAAAAYALVKQQLAKYHANDAKAYYDVKDPVCDLIMQAAELWVTATQWTLPPADIEV